MIEKENIISRYEYDRALDIVEAYHKQRRAQTIIKRDFNVLQAGNDIVFIKSGSKTITVGKPYRVLEVAPKFKIYPDANYLIIDDKGQSKYISKNDTKYSALFEEEYRSARDTSLSEFVKVNFTTNKHSYITVRLYNILTSQEAKKEFNYVGDIRKGKFLKLRNAGVKSWDELKRILNKHYNR